MSSQETKSVEDLELIISYVLRVGVLFAGSLLAAGWLWSLYTHGDTLSEFQRYEPHSLLESLQWAALMQDRAKLISFLGLIALVLLPVVRVLLTGILFFRQKERALGAMALLVFFSLIASFYLGIEV